MSVTHLVVKFKNRRKIVYHQRYLFKITAQSMLIADKYTEKYVVFLDLLGFKTRVKDADTNPEARQELLYALDIIRDSLCNYDRIGMRITHFSDCIIISANRTPEGLWEILESVNLLTINLLQEDFFVRGGMAVGGIHHDQEFVYGLAINKAYKIESEIATYPMTLVSCDVVADVKKNGSKFEDFLITDEDGCYFVHYLKIFSNYTQLPLYAGKLVLDEPGRRIIDFICHRLNTHTDLDLLEKNIWVQNYWNNTVAIRGVFSRIEAGITKRDLGHGPFRALRRIAG